MGLHQFVEMHEKADVNFAQSNSRKKKAEAGPLYKSVSLSLKNTRL
jgi:hypothetical protein